MAHKWWGGLSRPCPPPPPWLRWPCRVNLPPIMSLNPRCLQTTAVWLSVHCLPHTVPHLLSRHTSTLPSISDSPSTSLISPYSQYSAGMTRALYITHMHEHILIEAKCTYSYIVFCFCVFIIAHHKDNTLQVYRNNDNSGW